MAEEENKGTPLVPEDLAAEWGDDVSLSIPSAAQLPAKEEPTGDDDTTDDDDVTPPAPVEDEVEVEYVADPGEYTPADYSFEVTVFDKEGENGKTQKIASVEDWEKLMESDPNLGSTAAADKALRLASKMENNLDRDKAEYDKAKKKFDEVKQDEDTQAQQLTQWDNEIAYLINRGDLPEIDKKYVDADWSDPEVAKQDGVKEQLALLKFMEKENAARVKAKLKPMDSVLDAYNAFKLQDTSAKDDKPKAKEPDAAARKKAGSRVASGSSAPAGTGAPKGVAVGIGGSLDDLGANWF